MPHRPVHARLRPTEHPTNLTEEGTVDSYVQYYEGVHFFDGDVTAGDFFGFTVAFDFIPDIGNVILSGAYRDSDDGFEKGSIWYLQLGEVLSIEEIDENSNIQIFPNPSKQSFSLTNIKGITSIQIFDISGKKVQSFKSFSKNLFDVSYLPVGQYIIMISKSEGENFSFKLIKE